MAAIPKDGRGAAAFVGLFSMLSSLLSWSFSLIFSGLLAREVTHRVRGADYRAVGAAAYLGVGSVWALGLSSSAALIMAAPASLPQSIRQISGVIPLGETLGLWQSLLMAAVLLLVSMAIWYYSAPAPTQARGMIEMGVTYQPPARDVGRPERPGEWLEYSPILTVLVSGMGIAYLIREVAMLGPGILLELNHYVFAFLIVGLLLHWRPKSFVVAIAAAVPSVAGVLVQYPLYAGIVKMMTESGLARELAHFFVAVSNQHTFPVTGGYLLGRSRPVRAVRWREMADRSPLSAGGRQVSGSSPRLGCPDVQRHRGAGKPHPSILDAALAWHSWPEGARHCRILDAAVCHPRAVGAVPRLDPELHARVRGTGRSVILSSVFCLLYSESFSIPKHRRFALFLHELVELGHDDVPAAQ